MRLARHFSFVLWCDVRYDFRIKTFGSCLPPVVCLIYVICICFCIVVSNTFCVVFLLSFSSSCVPYIASFSGLSIFHKLICIHFVGVFLPHIVIVCNFRISCRLVFKEPECPFQNKKEICIWNNYIYFGIILLCTFQQILNCFSVQNQIPSDNSAYHHL